MKSTRWMALGGAVVTAMLITAIVGIGGAVGSTVTGASFTGAAGTVSVGGTLYAKQGGALTLTVSTSSDTKCVDINIHIDQVGGSLYIYM